MSSVDISPEAVHRNCGRCGGPPDHALGTGWMCRICFDRLLGHARSQWHAEEYGIGIMRQAGVLRPDHGADYAECRCSLCGATAVEVVGEPCYWCERSIERMIGWQREKLLHPDLPEPSDSIYANALRGWVARLANAIKAEIITDDEARSAIHRRVHGRAA